MSWLVLVGNLRRWVRGMRVGLWERERGRLGKDGVVGVAGMGMNAPIVIDGTCGMDDSLILVLSYTCYRYVNVNVNAMINVGS